LPSWLWNYRNPVKVMPKHLRRTVDDIYETVNYLITNKLTPTVLEPTPRVASNLNLRWETSITIITQTVPRELIEDIYDKLYKLIVCNLTESRIVQEISELLPQISNDEPQENSTNRTLRALALNEIRKNKLGNELRWIITNSYTIFANKFIESCKTLRKDQIVGRVKILMELICGEPFHDGIYDEYFSSHKWTKQNVQNLTREISRCAKLNNFSCDTCNSIDAVFFTINKKRKI
jgi:hypothetical protein